jgi:hypothetical protein
MSAVCFRKLRTRRGRISGTFGVDLLSWDGPRHKFSDTCFAQALAAKSGPSPSIANQNAVKWNQDRNIEVDSSKLIEFKRGELDSEE